MPTLHPCDKGIADKQDMLMGLLDRIALHRGSGDLGARTRPITDCGLAK